MNKGKTIFAFLLGAGVGSLLTWKLLEERYAQIADEEIESVREMYENEIRDLERELDDSYHEEVEEVDDDEEDQLAEEKKASAKQYKKMVTELQYTAENNEEEEEDDVMGPYLITAEELGEEYDVVSLTYYADGFLADDYDELIENVDNVVGTESLNHFGDDPNDPDTVYVRNDVDKLDYEICRSEERYIDVRAQRYTED